MNYKKLADSIYNEIERLEKQRAELMEQRAKIDDKISRCYRLQCEAWLLVKS